MLKCLLIVLCAITIVVCAPGYENSREKQSTRDEHVADQSSASRTKRQSMDTVEIVYVDAASIDPIKLNLQSRETPRLAPVNNVNYPRQNYQQLSGNNLEVVTQNSNYVVYKLKSTDDLPMNSLPQGFENQFYNYNSEQYAGYSGMKDPSPPPPPPDGGRPPPPPPPPHHHPPPPPPHHHPPPPPHHHHHGPPPPPPDDDNRSSYYDRRDRGPRPPRYDEPSDYHRGPPPHYGGRPPRDGPPGHRYERGPPPHRGGPPDRYERGPPPHHGGPPPPRGGPPDRYERRPPPHHGRPPHHGGPPHRFDDGPPPPPDRNDDRPDQRPPPPDQDPYYDQGNGNNDHSQKDDNSQKDNHPTDATPTSSTTEAKTEDDDDQYQLDVRFNDEEQAPVETKKRDVTVTAAPRLSPFIFQAAAVTPED